jgi:hypothetical protein
MRNRKSTWTQLFAHREDEAFELLTGLETLFARMFPSRGSRWLRTRLHKASARLAEIVIISAGAKELGPLLGVNVKLALAFSQIIDGILKLLRSYYVLNHKDLEEAMKLATRLVKVIGRRFFGIESDDSDDGSSPPPSTSASVPTAQAPRVDIAAEGPPIFS